MNCIALAALLALALAADQEAGFRPRPVPEPNPTPAPKLDAEKAARPVLEGIGKAIGRVGQTGGKVLDAAEHAIGLPQRIETAVVWILGLTTAAVVAVYAGLGLAAIKMWRG